MAEADGSHVVVTGASQGIGKAIVTRLASTEHCVHCVSRSDPQFHGEWAGRVTWSALDLSNGSAVEQYVASLESFSIRALILSAVDYGIGGRHLVSATPAAEWQRVIATNLVGHCVMVSRMLPKLMGDVPGIIVNISSDVAVVPAAGRAAYAASKAGLHAMLRAVEAEHGAKGPRIYQLIPTFQSITTGIRRRRPDHFDFSSYADPALIAEVVDRIVSPSKDSAPGGTYLVRRDGRLERYQEIASI